MPKDLKSKFCSHILKKWVQNNHSLKDISCVYAIISINIENKSFDIEYIGSTTILFSRYKSHKIPDKIHKNGLLSLLYYMPMRKGFYDYEIKLIKKLQPILNKQHKK